MAMTLSGGDDLRAEINVTPLVDVVLVLLVILLLMAPMLKEELPVELPVATHASDSGAAIPTLTMSEDGSVAFEGEPIPSGDLARRLAAIYAPRVDKTIMLAADRHLDYGRVVEVMDACRAAGVERIGVVTVPDRAR